MQYYTIKDYFGLVIYLNQNTTHILIKKIILKEIGGDEIMSHIHEVLRREAEEMRKKAIEEGLQEGRKKGLQEGRKEGRKESLIDVAKKMLKEKVDIDFITKITGLKKEQFVK